MMIKASGRSALIVTTGLFVCFAGVSWTTAATEAASSKSETVTATKSVKQGTRSWKRYAHRRHSRTALTSSENKKAAEKDVADAGGDVPAAIPPVVANANAQLIDAPSDTAQAMTARANAILLAAADTQAPADNQVTAPDQLNDVDRALQESKPASQTVAMASNSTVKAAAPALASSDTSTWDETSLIGKIFIAFGALLTVASAARMFMA